MMTGIDYGHELIQQQRHNSKWSHSKPDVQRKKSDSSGHASCIMHHHDNRNYDTTTAANLPRSDTSRNSRIEIPRLVESETWRRRTYLMQGSDTLPTVSSGISRNLCQLRILRQVVTGSSA